jgi:hypothetical protein
MTDSTPNAPPKATFRLQTGEVIVLDHVVSVDLSFVYLRDGMRCRLLDSHGRGDDFMARSSRAHSDVVAAIEAYRRART